MTSEKEVIAEIPGCIDAACTGWLVDSISGKYYIRCRDPKHNLAEESDRNTKNEAGDQPAPSVNAARADDNIHDAEQGISECYNG